MVPATRTVKEPDWLIEEGVAGQGGLFIYFTTQIAALACHNHLEPAVDSGKYKST